MRIRLVATSLLLIGMLGNFALAETFSGGVSTSFTVSGKVTNHTRIDLALLQSLPVVNANVTFFAAGAVVSETYTGALLWDLLKAVNIVVDPAIKNDILHKTVVIIGSDGYEAVFGAGEIDPEFGGSQVIIAYAGNGKSLESEGFAKIIVPGDKAGGRFVSNIVKIEVRSQD